jgi:hypothetical protein
METMSVTIELKGDEVKQFTDYKAKEFLRSNAEAARKLMLERLAQSNSAEQTKDAA